MFQKANTLYKILDAVNYKEPIRTEEERKLFYVDFSNYRGAFRDNRIFKYLNINTRSFECNDLREKQIIFLAGHRGSGKTTELNKIAKKIEEKQCYYTIICNVDEALDLNNLIFVDILLYMLETLINRIKNDKIEIPHDILKPFYEWFSQRIDEINQNKKSQIKIASGVTGKIGILSFFKIFTDMRVSLSGTNETKTIIRTTFTNKFSDFSLKINELFYNIVDILKKEGKGDLLFIIDGIEKIGSLEMKKKVLLEDSNQLKSIKTNMIISLPIELMKNESELSNFSKVLSFPVVKIQERDGKYIQEAIDKFKEFIDKRVNRKLFSSDKVIEDIIKFSGGSPRELLRIISEVFSEADDILDEKALKDAIRNLSSTANYLTKKKLNKLKNIKEALDSNTQVEYDDVLSELLEKKIVYEYNSGSYVRVNPIIATSRLYKENVE